MTNVIAGPVHPIFRPTELSLTPVVSAGGKLPKWARLFLAAHIYSKLAMKRQARRIMEAYEPSDALIPAHYLVTARVPNLVPEQAYKVFARTVTLFAEINNLHEEYAARWDAYTNVSFIADFFPASIYIETWLTSSDHVVKLPKGGKIVLADSSKVQDYWNASMSSVTQRQVDSLKRKNDFAYREGWLAYNPVSLKVSMNPIMKGNLRHDVSLTAYGFLAEKERTQGLLSTAYFSAVMLPAVKQTVSQHEAFIILGSYLDVSYFSLKERSVRVRS